MKAIPLPLVVLAALLPLPTLAAVPAETVQRLDALEARWASHYLKPDDARERLRLDSEAARALGSLSEDGRFSDLTYGPIITGRDGGTGWGEHLRRVSEVFTAWRTPGTHLHRDESVARRAGRAVEVYVTAPYDAADTWGFGHPYADLIEGPRLGRICLFARTDPATFPQETVERWAARIILSIFRQHDEPGRQFREHLPGWEGGANVLWAARGELARFLVDDDQDLRLRAAQGYLGHIWSSMRERSGKGPNGEIERLTVDGMLGEHAVPAMGSYGEWYLNEVVSYRNMLEGVRGFEMPDELNAFWIDVLLDSVAHCYQGAIDPNLANPLTWVAARSGSNSTLRRWLQAFRGRGHREEEIDAFLAWEPGVTPWPRPERTVKRYHTTDFVTKHYPLWNASLRAVSERTMGSETFSTAESDKGRQAEEAVLLPLGTAFVRRDTREFQDAAVKGGGFALMDFARLPGQINKLVSSEALRDLWHRDRAGANRYVRGNMPFSGGAETAHTAVMGWWQSRDVRVDAHGKVATKLSPVSVDARRASFFLEHAIVHLAAGVRFDDTGVDAAVSVEQRLSGGPTRVGGIGESGEEGGSAPGEVRGGWVWHDSVGYLLPAEPASVVRDVVQYGGARRVFSVYSLLGRASAGRQFAWAVFPGVQADEMARLSAQPGWEVLENSERVQAIRVHDGGGYAAVFHEAGELTLPDGVLRVSRPVVLIVLRCGDGWEVRAGDPLGRAGMLEVYLGDAGADIALPEGVQLGATAAARLVSPPRPTS